MTESALNIVGFELDGHFSSQRGSNKSVFSDLDPTLATKDTIIFLRLYPRAIEDIYVLRKEHDLFFPPGIKHPSIHTSALTCSLGISSMVRPSIRVGVLAFADFLLEALFLGGLTKVTDITETC